MSAEVPVSLVVIVKWIASGLVVLAQFRMVRRVALGRMKAVVLSWAGWALLMGISVLAQIIATGWTLNVLGVLLSACGCLVIAVVGRWTGHYSRGRGDVLCLLAGLLCMGAFLLFRDPWITTGLAILADLLVAIPMLERAFRDPIGHRTSAWLLTCAAWAITCVGILLDFHWLHLLWPLYLVGFSGLMSWLSFFRPRRMARSRDV